MRYKTFDKPHSHDAEWYKDREVADHINQGGHRPRLMQVKDYVIELVGNDETITIADFGCGNGGLMREIQKELPNNKIWGYDLCPANIEDSHQKGNTENIKYLDFVNEEVEFPNIAIATEVLEHLVDPDAFIKRLLDNGVEYIVASSPDYESPSYHAPFHLWVFNGDSYKEMFEQQGWKVLEHKKAYFQYIIAKNK
jgi:2-polyprenyl-3-methyl-5-hydroxy-6-metoxy-1,4-benzoquinol methylase